MEAAFVTPTPPVFPATTPNVCAIGDLSATAPTVKVRMINGRESESETETESESESETETEREGRELLRRRKRGYRNNE